MVIRFLALAFLVFGSTMASAQIGVGLRGGLLASTNTGSVVLSGDETEFDYEYVTGYLIGIPIEFSVGSTFALQTEVNFLSRGFIEREDQTSNTPEFKATYNALEIPLLAKFGYISDRFGLAIVVGPSFQYATSGNLETQTLTVGGITVVEESEIEVDFDDATFENFNRGTVYGIAGLEASIPLGYGKIILDARYRFGISDEDSSNEIEIRGRGISGTVGYMFTFGDY